MARATTSDATSIEARDEDDPESSARARWADARGVGLAAADVPIRCSPVHGAVTLGVRDWPNGPWTTVRALATRSDNAVVLPGEAMAVAVASVAARLAAVRTDRGVFVIDLDRAATVLAFEAAADDAIAMGAHASAVVVHVGQSLLVASADGRVTRLPFPAAPQTGANAARPVVTERTIAVTSDENLFTIDRASLRAGEPGVVAYDDLVIAPRVDAKPDDEVCVVRSTLSRFVALTHVREQRHFNHSLASPEEAATFAKGERVYVQGASLVRERDLAPAESAVADRLLPAAGLAPLRPLAAPDDVLVTSPARDGAATYSVARGFAELASAIALRSTPLLDRFVARHDGDRAFEAVSFHVTWELAPSVTAVSHGITVDPCAFQLIDEGSGDWYGFYDYPPARAAGHGIVRYLHDENKFVWVATSFEGYLAGAIRDALHDGDEEAAHAACRLLRMLDLPITFLDGHPRLPRGQLDAPEWFTRVYPPEPPYRTRDAAGTLALGDTLRASGDWLAAERAYVRALHDTLEEALRAVLTARLAEVYSELGWAHHAARITT